MTRRAGQRGAVLPLALAAGSVLVAAAAAVLTLGVAHTAAARAQTAADVAAVAAVRALAAGGAAGSPAPAARRAAAVSGATVVDLRVGEGPTPTVDVLVAVDGPLGTRVSARARAGRRVRAPAAGGRVSRATGGGYAGPLVFRDGKPTCPAVAAAFDRMDAAARADGVDLVVTSGFRSDAEQAELFRRHPDPRWVAPPGRSRHRDATELDISTAAGAGAWLAAHAPRFGFIQRYSWEPWHWGYVPGCGAADVDGGEAVPPWVPAAYRDMVAATARREGLPAALLAALLRAESGFDPRAVSPAGARGIAQLMPATARGLGVSDPFDPSQAVPAAGRLLAGHLRAFGSPSLALAAYNAGAGAVLRYGGVPPYPETRAYVARVLALTGGAAGEGEVVLMPIRESTGTGWAS